MKARTHRELDVWNDGIEFVSEIYELTRAFPEEERFGITRQMRRAAISIPSNIAEGAARGSRREFAHYVSMARGSLAELETQLLIAERLGFLDGAAPPTEAINRLYARLSKLHQSLRAVRSPT